MNDVLIIGFDDNKPDVPCLAVERPLPDGTRLILGAHYGDKATDLYNQLVNIDIKEELEFIAKIGAKDGRMYTG